MKLYVALKGYYYEGFCEPVGIFSTREKAEDALKNQKYQADINSVYEYTLDVENEYGN
jgi:hypothetical protein